MNKAYAIWRLKTDDGKYFSGPEETIISSGGSAEPIYSGTFNSVEVILGKIYVDLAAIDLSPWNLSILTKTEAKKFISDNFTNHEDKPNNPMPRITLDDLQSRLD